MEAMITSEKLAEAGVAEPQAKAHARAHQETLDEAKKYADELMEKAKKELATKGDLAELRAELRADLAEMEMRLMRFAVVVAFGTLTVQTGLIAILLMLFLERT